MAALKHPHWREGETPAQNARRVLPKLAARYFAAVRALLATNPKPAELHALRLASKQFRYTLELFRPCYAAGLEERIAALRRVQDLLGECNDAVTALAVVEGALGRAPAQRRQMRDWLCARAAEKAGAFREHWAGEFDAPGQEARWTQYLARQARTPARGRATG